jgi:DNA-binding LytR/AlgR family response regulator
VHRRWLVRRYAIAELRTRRTGGGEINLVSGKKVPVGRSYLKRLRETLRSPRVEVNGFGATLAAF